MAVSTPRVRRFWPFGVAAILLLVALGIRWARTTTARQEAAPPPTETAPAPLPTHTPTSTASLTATPTSTPAPIGVLVPTDLPEAYAARAREALASLGAIQIGAQSRPIKMVSGEEEAAVRVALLPFQEALAARVHSGEQAVYVLAERYYAVVAPFQTVRDDVTMAELQARWAGEGEGPLYVTERAAAELGVLFGAPALEAMVASDLNTRLEASSGALGIAPFDALDPSYKVLTVDGVNVLSNRLDPASYPLAVALVLQGAMGPNLGPHLAPSLAEYANRNAERLTTLIMTGVTAMCRLTADRMEKYGTLYPARIISDVLRAADITHVSNEVPFIQGCQVDTTPNNLVFCSDYRYWEALEAIGADLVGLSGNHVNDWGYAGARESLAFYRGRKIPIYGSGLNIDEACAPLIVEHHGNKFAFLATLAWNPAAAWATETQPGACYFYDHQERLLESIRSLREEVDLVLVELQYLETYNPFPTAQQVDEFRELREAGAHVVTGVQSHVPQAWEPYGQGDPGGPGIILYGLGNLFFDQMWSWETRTGLIARHTIYEGRLLSSEVLTTVLEDYAQPRWATPEERAEILGRIFAAAPKRPASRGD